MGLSKKLLIGSLVGIVTTTVVIGTAVGISVNRNSDANLSNNTQSDDTNQLGINLNNLVKKINKDSILIKQLENGNALGNAIDDFSSIYAFNVVSSQLSLKEGTIPAEVEAKFDLGTNSNSATSLNSGNLNIKVQLKHNEQSVETNVELSGFKTNETTDFQGLFESGENKYVLKIDPQMDQDLMVKYVDLHFLNNQQEITKKVTNELRSLQASDIHKHASEDDQEQGGEPAAAEDEEIPVTTTETITGLTFWLRQDQTKKQQVADLKIEGQVRLAKISKEGQTGSEKTYFHLVSKDTNSRIKLVKDNKEVAISEIKTTNLLASDISVVPINLDETRQKEYLEQLQNVGKGMDSSNQYETKYNNPSLNRNLAIDLGMNTNHNYVFVKPHLVTKPKENNAKLPVSLVVKFGENDYLTTYRTSVSEELNELFNAGFSFGIYSKKLTAKEHPIKPETLTGLKTELENYFKPEKYLSPSNRTSATGDNSPMTHPGGFSLVNVNKESIATSLMIDLTNQSEDSMSQNWISFANYSYAGMGNNKILLTPSLSLIHLEGETINS